MKSVLTREILYGLCSPDEMTRERTADSITDIVSAFAEVEAKTLGYMLSCLISTEENSAAMESQLNALVETIDHHRLSRDVFAQLESMRGHVFGDSRDEHLASLFDENWEP